MVKRFLEWIRLKEKLHARNHRPPYFKEGEIWWCNIGENVGTEVNGKGDNFARSVRVFKKLSGKNFIGIPLTTRNRYAAITFRGNVSVANLSQIRVVDYRRMLNKLGDLDEGDFERTRDRLRGLLF
jgi:mRNA interferase MazF